MKASGKRKVILRSQDLQTVQELRQILSVWCDLHQVADLKSIAELSSASTAPLALILEPPAAVPAASSEAAGPDHEMIRALTEARERFPIMRRIVIADHQDLSVIIHGLHIGVIDGLLHRPFDTSSVCTALRIQRLTAAPAITSESVTR